jgi:uncharacterized membrane protein YbhN (UPF0104 family)
MNKTKKILLLKSALGIICFLFIWFKIKDQFSPEKKELFLSTLNNENALLFFMCTVALMLPNWLIESYKWQLISSVIEKISFSSAIKGVFSGICIGNLTPGRMGEFAGKLIYFRPENRSKITVTHFVCGSTQLFVTVFTGLISLLLFFNAKNTEPKFLLISVIFSVLAFAVLFFILFKTNSIYEWISRLKWLKKFQLGTVEYPRKIILLLILLSIIRYFVFSSQYIILLKTCGANASYFELFVPVSISFMLMSTIPMISFIEVAVRAGIALVLFSNYISNDLLIVSASSALWLINIILPSIIGYFIILSTKIKLKHS